jgi:hypothetical protein
MEGTAMFKAPPFDTHTIVYAKYCDGGSFTGAMSNPPIAVGNDTIYFRGRGIFDGIFDDLLKNRGLAQVKYSCTVQCIVYSTVSSIVYSTVVWPR